MATKVERARAASLGGAVLAALAASSCCLGPLLLAALGVGGAGAMATLAAYRPHLLAGTALLLVAGFYLTYRKPRDACGCDKPRVNRIGLWIATGAVVLVAAAPALLGEIAKSRVTADPSANLAHATLDVRGVDCAACAMPIRKALAKVGGFRDLDLDVAKQTARVTYEAAPGRLAAYVAAIDALGYETRVREE